MKRILMASLCASAALVMTSAYAAENQLGKIEPAKDLMGRAVHNSREKIGDIKDFVVDLESGRILYSLVSTDGKLRCGTAGNARTISFDIDSVTSERLFPSLKALGAQAGFTA